MLEPSYHVVTFNFRLVLIGLVTDKQTHQAQCMSKVLRSDHGICQFILMILSTQTLNLRISECAEQAILIVNQSYSVLTYEPQVDTATRHTPLPGPLSHA